MSDEATVTQDQVDEQLKKEVDQSLQEMGNALRRAMGNMMQVFLLKPALGSILSNQEVLDRISGLLKDQYIQKDNFEELLNLSFDPSNFDILDAEEIDRRISSAIEEVELKDLGFDVDDFISAEDFDPNDYLKTEDLDEVMKESGFIMAGPGFDFDDWHEDVDEKLDMYKGDLRSLKDAVERLEKRFAELDQARDDEDKADAMRFERLDESIGVLRQLGTARRSEEDVAEICEAQIDRRIGDRVLPIGRGFWGRMKWLFTGR